MNTCRRPNVLRLGTRGSLLARVQSQWVADEVERLNPDVRVELIICKTTGDRIADRALADSGGKGLFTKELEEALLEHRIDFAVHSYKDVPVTMPLVDQAELVVAAVPARADARDVVISRKRWGLNDLPRGARVGTGSLRRRCQLLAVRPDLRVEPVRGNVDTRLKKLFDEQYDAIVLAVAGLVRSGTFDDRLMVRLEPSELLPAAGQGALAVQCRRTDLRTQQMLRPMNNAQVRTCVDLERRVVSALGGDCTSPIAAYARFDETGSRLSLHAAVGARGGRPPVVRSGAEFEVEEIERTFDVVLRGLVSQNAADLLERPSAVSTGVRCVTSTTVASPTCAIPLHLLNRPVPAGFATSSIVKRPRKSRSESLRHVCNS